MASRTAVLAAALAASGGAACASTPEHPAGPPPLWVERFGDGATQKASGVAVDASGDVLVAGSFEGALDFGAGPLAAEQGGSIFAAKLDPAGHAIWSKAWSEPMGTAAHGVVTDFKGNALLVGRGGAAPADPTNTLVSGFFLTKLDPSGATVWQTPLANGAYGQFNLTSGGAGYAMLSAKTAGGLYVAMVDPTGESCWDLTFPFTCTNGMAAIAANANAFLAITGFYACATDFGGGPLPVNGRDSAFVAAFNSSGVLVWSRGAGAAGGDVRGASVVMDDAGDVFVTGSYTGTLDLGAGPLPASSGGMFVAEWGPTGSLLWGHGFDGASPTASNGLALSAAGHVFVLGTATASADLGDGAGAPGTFVLELTSAGVYAKAYHFLPSGAASSLEPAGIAAGTDVAFAASLAGNADFGAGPVVSSGPFDVVVGKLPSP